MILWSYVLNSDFFGLKISPNIKNSLGSCAAGIVLGRLDLMLLTAGFECLLNDAQRRTELTFLLAYKAKLSEVPYYAVEQRLQRRSQSKHGGEETGP